MVGGWVGGWVKEKDFARAWPTAIVTLHRLSLVFLGEQQKTNEQGPGPGPALCVSFPFPPAHFFTYSMPDGV